MGRRAWLLGAGFSKAISPLMPTMHELGLQICAAVGGEERALALVSESERNALEAGLVPMGDLEVWLTTLTSPQPFLDDSELLRRRALSVELSSRIAERITETQSAVRAAVMPNWLAALVALWHHSQDVVITLNYDTLIESALNELRLLPRAAQEQHPSLLFDALRDYPQLVPAMRWGSDGFKPTLELIKLHGSVNWFRLRGSGQVARADEVVAAWHPGDPPVPHYLEAPMRGASRALLLPQSDKSSGYGDAVISNLWRRARELLEPVDELVIFGYSMPATDTSVAALLAQCLSPTAEVAIIDLAPEPVRSRLNRLGIGESGANLLPGTVECDEAFRRWLRQRATLDSEGVNVLTPPYYVGAHDQHGTEWGAATLEETADELTVTLDAEPQQWPYSYISLVAATEDQLSKAISLRSADGAPTFVMGFHTASGANLGTNVVLDIIHWNGSGPPGPTPSSSQQQGEPSA